LLSLIYWEKLGQKTASPKEYDIKVRWTPTEEVKKKKIYGVDAV
jgi:hypothetical protein